MTTTPTLYVLGYDGDIGPFRYARPATHDELIAAIPRCGTCECVKKEFALGYPGIPTWIRRCTNEDSPVFGVEVGQYFGCTEHKERV